MDKVKKVSGLLEGHEEMEFSVIARTKTKPETEQEMAEWLAENVLKTEVRILSSFGIRPRGCVLHKRYWVDVDTFIYSPDGFFAVVHKIPVETKMKIHKHLLAWFYGYDYEAFYNAVWEAWE